jgi:PIN domain nuclease of toxin-antitoxin system
MFLLDSHVLLWSAAEPHRLSAAGRAAVESREFKVSVASLWELLVKKNRSIAPVRDPLAWWERHITRLQIEVVTIRVPHVAELDRLPELHGDPFDRMLIAQARTEGLRLVTADRIFSRYDVETVW